MTAKADLNCIANKDARTANTGFASSGVSCKLEDLCFYSSSVLVDSLVLRNPPERKARNRCDAIGVGPAVGRLEDRVSQFLTNFAVAKAEGLEAAAKLVKNREKKTSQI